MCLRMFNALVPISFLMKTQAFLFVAAPTYERFFDILVYFTKLLLSITSAHLYKSNQFIILDCCVSHHSSGFVIFTLKAFSCLFTLMSLVQFLTSNFQFYDSNCLDK